MTQPLALHLTTPLVGLLLLFGFGVYLKLKTDIPAKLRVPVMVYIIALVAMTALAWTLGDSDARMMYGLAKPYIIRASESPSVHARAVMATSAIM